MRAYPLIVDNFTSSSRQVAIKKQKRPWGGEVLAKRTYREVRLLHYMQESWISAESADSAAIDDDNSTGAGHANDPPIQHVNIIELRDVWLGGTGPVQEEDLFMVMEHGGKDLQSVSRKYALSVDQVRFVSYNIVKAFLYLHSAGLIHRDLKPQNIAIDPVTLDTKILDFGLSRIENTSSSIQTGYVATRYYRAPEVIMTWQHYGTAVDMWSIGCIIAELLMQGPPGRRRPLFPGGSYVDQLYAIAKYLGKPDAAYLAKIDEKARQWVENSLSDDMVRRRFADLAVFGAGTDTPPDAEAMDLLECLLIYDPAKRLTAQQAIEHPFFEKYRRLETEYVTHTKFDDSVERLKLDVDGWRQRTIEQIDKYHSFSRHRAALKREVTELQRHMVMVEHFLQMYL